MRIYFCEMSCHSGFIFMKNTCHPLKYPKYYFTLLCFLSFEISFFPFSVRIFNPSPFLSSNQVISSWASCVLARFLCYPISSVMEFESFLAVFGGLSLAYLGVKLIIQIIQGLRTFILPSIGFRNNLKKFGDWAGKNNLRARCTAIPNIKFIPDKKNI